MWIDDRAVFLPESFTVENTIRLRRNICGIQIVAARKKPEAKLGGICSLPAGAMLDICGKGFNERTIKVHWQDSFYFVFKQDVDLL
ncbi:MAG: hypothetical protein M3Y27_08345 [Acidobacteriota bacterium]|nr:hypothetical protein [Acidobacteriota bacterium]